MPLFIHKEPKMEEIPLDRLLVRTLELKKRGYRVAQICAAYVEPNYELSYTFVNAGNFDMITLRIVIGLTEKVPSITEIYPYATFYENEMQEMFGVNMEMIKLNYRNRLYRIDEEMPFLPEKAKEERRAEEEALAGKEAAEKAAAPAQKKEAN